MTTDHPYITLHSPSCKMLDSYTAVTHQLHHYCLPELHLKKTPFISDISLTKNTKYKKQYSKES